MDECNVFPIFSGVPQVSASAGASRASQECYKLVAELEVAMLPTSHRSNVTVGSMDLQAGPNLTSILGLRSRLTLRVTQDLMTATGSGEMLESIKEILSDKSLDAIGDPLQVGRLCSTCRDMHKRTAMSPCDSPRRKRKFVRPMP